jgi:hypothetical protein
VNARELLSEIKRRTLLLALASGGELSHDEAEREAARSVIAEAKAQRRSAYVGTANPSRDGVTVQNARAFLTNYLSALNARMRSPISPRGNSGDTPELKRKRVLITPRPKITDASPQPGVATTGASASAGVEPAPEQQPSLLLFASNAGSATLLSDDEFHRSVHSHVTQSWRASIEHNNRVAEERARKRLSWVG